MNESVSQNLLVPQGKARIWIISSDFHRIFVFAVFKRDNVLWRTTAERQNEPISALVQRFFEGVHPEGDCLAAKLSPGNIYKRGGWEKYETSEWRWNLCLGLTRPLPNRRFRNR
jgi:hypothetical protein